MTLKKVNARDNDGIWYMSPVLWVSWSSTSRPKEPTVLLTRMAKQTATNGRSENLPAAVLAVGICRSVRVHNQSILPLAATGHGTEGLLCQRTTNPTKGALQAQGRDEGTCEECAA